MRTALLGWLLWFGLGMFLSPCLAASPASRETEKGAGDFQAIFNGRDFSGWTDTKGWKIDDGAFYRGGGLPEIGVGLTYAKRLPDDFELRFEWKEAVKPAPKGIVLDWYFDSDCGLKQGGGSMTDRTGTTYSTHVETLYRAGGNWIVLTTGELDLGPNPIIEPQALGYRNSRRKHLGKPLGEWNEGRIKCYGAVIEHWINGTQVMRLDLLDMKNRTDKVEQKLLFGNWMSLRTQGLQLQIQWDESPAWYRGFKLREIKGAEVTAN
jgi:hypothetical protein